MRIMVQDPNMIDALRRSCRDPRAAERDARGSISRAAGMCSAGDAFLLQDLKCAAVRHGTRDRCGSVQHR